jgi:hypothetical protein
MGIQIRHPACSDIAPMKAIEDGIADTNQSVGPEPGVSLEALLPDQQPVQGAPTRDRRA